MGPSGLFDAGGRRGFTETWEGTRDGRDLTDSRDSRDQALPGSSPDIPVVLLSLSSLVGLPYCSFPTLTIHGIPNRSTSMPNRTAQKVSSNGMLILPFSASALKTRSASATSVKWRDT
jgi:hypothetical protein